MVFDNFNVDNLSIDIPQGVVRSGSTLNGRFSFGVSKNLTFRRVTLCVKGKEKTEITETRHHAGHDGQPSRTEHIHHKGKSQAVGIEVMLLGAVEKVDPSWSATLAPGSYNFPFSIPIPANAPPSISHLSEGNATAKIEYTCKVRISIPMSKDVKKKKDFYVLAAMPVSQRSNSGPYTHRPSAVQRTKCCCCAAGVTMMGCVLERSNLLFGADSQLRGTLLIDNTQSDLPLKSLNVILTESCWIRASNRERVINKQISTTRVDVNIEKHENGERQFQFALNIPTDCANRCAATYRGHVLNHYYNLVVGTSWTSFFSFPIPASNSLDETNTALPIDGNRPGPVVSKHSEAVFLYMAPPGQEASLPPQAPGVLEAPRGNTPFLPVPNSQPFSGYGGGQGPWAMGAANPQPGIPVNTAVGGYGAVGAAPAYGVPDYTPK